jgi:hypothetical protein
MFFFLSSSVIIWVREYRGIGTLLRINGSFYEANSLAVNQPLYCTPKLYEDEQQVNEYMREVDIFGNDNYYKKLSKA